MLEKIKVFKKTLIEARVRALDFWGHRSTIRPPKQPLRLNLAGLNGLLKLINH